MELAQELNDLRAENRLLKGALAEAGQFAVKRLPHDAREYGKTSEYFQKMFMDCAIETEKSNRGEENAKVD